jgi:tetratricopeptide (TPR) repeat protein
VYAGVKKFLATLIVFSAAFATPSRAQEDLKARLDALRAQGYQSLYNLDYDAARRSFRQMIELAPDHPAGAQCMAASFWVQQLNESWELKATLYSTKTYTQENKTQDPALKEEFRNWIRNAKQLSQARLSRNANDQEALYFLGAAEGLEAAFSAAVQRKFMAALRSGSDAVEHHRAVLRANPDQRDAELTIGLYNYIVGSLPLPLKLVAGSFGVHGSKKRGLETLEKVSREGHWARDVALVLLVDLYKREQRWHDAIEVSRSLASRYPRNFLFKLQLADALTEASDTKANLIEVESIFARLVTENLIDSSAIDLVHFRYAETLLRLGDPARAMIQYRLVVNHKESELGLKSMSRLRLAQCLDLQGKRSEAIASYRVILANPDTADLIDEARKGIREPYRLEKP